MGVYPSDAHYLYCDFVQPFQPFHPSDLHEGSLRPVYFVWVVGLGLGLGPWVWKTQSCRTPVYVYPSLQEVLYFICTPWYHRHPYEFRARLGLNPFSASKSLLILNSSKIVKKRVPVVKAFQLPKLSCSSLSPCVCLHVGSAVLKRSSLWSG